MWFQARTAIADLLTPVLAALKTLWLLFFTPRNFFHAFCFHTRALDRLLSPVDPLWRALSREARRPLDPAHFLLFGILAAALAGFDFDNSNQLLGLLQRTGAVDSALDTLARQSLTLEEVITAGRTFFAHPAVAAVRSFFNLAVVAAVVELLINLFVLMLFAYLFYLLAGRRLSATHSYGFWLYMAGLQFFTTAVSFLFFSFFSLSQLGLPEIAPNIFFWLLETGLRLYWRYLLPAFLLPRLFANLTTGRVLLAALVARTILAGLGWFLTIGLVALATLVGALAM